MAAESFNTDYFNQSWMAYLLVGTSLPANFPASGGTVYLGLSTTIPDREGNNVTEPSGGAYARLAIACSTARFVKKAPGIYAVKSDLSTPAFLQFAIPTAAWTASQAPVISFCFFDALTNGNLLHVDTRIINPQWIDMKAGRLQIPDCWIRVGIREYGQDRVCISHYLSDALMAANYNAASAPTSLSSGGVWPRLTQTLPLPTDTGATLTLDQPYATAITGPNWTNLKPGVYGNTYEELGAAAYSLNFAGWAACDASANGHLLWAGAVNPPGSTTTFGPLPVINPFCLQLGLGD
jgi:hypothetical protein